MPNFTAEKSDYSLVQKGFSVYIANFALRDNCEEGEESTSQHYFYSNRDF